MGLLDNYSGIGMSPRPKWDHQRVMGHFYARAVTEVWNQGLDILTEATVTDDWDDLAPDLVIFDAKYRPLSIIEITTHKECRAIIRKCDELIARFPQTEYFVYDYERLRLYAYDPDVQEWFTSEEYELCSRYLARPLLEYFV